MGDDEKKYDHLRKIVSFLNLTTSEKYSYLLMFISIFFKFCCIKFSLNLRRIFRRRQRKTTIFTVCKIYDSFEEY